MNKKSFYLIVFLLSVMVYPARALGKLPEFTSIDEAEKALQLVNEKIIVSPKQADLYVTRGDIYFIIHEFDSAEEDYTRAIALDENIDAAYFGRGMVLGRMGYIKEGIADLTIFITRNPDSSLAYTKRGVRYIWLGDRENAFNDLTKAVQLDPNNAEAHDDLGVVYAQKGEFGKAIEHFQATISIDASYQKAYHNLAMAYYITENDSNALISVDVSLMMAPDFRDSLLLKCNILESLGRFEEAKKIREEAAFMPESGDWTEHAPVQ